MIILQPLFDDLKVRWAVTVDALITLKCNAHSDAMMDHSRYGIFFGQRARLYKNQVSNT
jgi:hypothetical protein